jgi:hypothetical protein
MEARSILTHETETTVGRASRAPYPRERRRKMHDLTFDTPEEMERLRLLAAGEGYTRNFNGWVLAKLYAALSGSIYPAGYVEGIQEYRDRVRRWLDNASEDATESAKEVRTMRAQKENLMFLLNQLPGGPETVARFLQEQQTQGASL